MAEAFIVVPSEPVYKTVTVEVPGIQGVAGKDGKDGSDGATFKPTVNANGDLSWTNDQGLANPETVNIKGPKGVAGQDGKTPVLGVDYFTETDKQEIVNSVLASLVDGDKEAY